MRKALVIGLIAVGFAMPARGQFPGAAPAKQLRTTGDELFCVKENDLLFFAAAKNSQNPKDRNVPGCSVLPRGLRYTVINAVHGEQKSVVKVQLKRRGATIDGYMMGAAQ